VEQLFPPVDFCPRAFHVLHYDMITDVDPHHSKAESQQVRWVLLRLHIKKKKEKTKTTGFWSIFYF
jgi:hypothetical protein